MNLLLSDEQVLLWSKTVCCNSLSVSSDRSVVVMWVAVDIWWCCSEWLCVSCDGNYNEFSGRQCPAR